MDLFYDDLWLSIARLIIIIISIYTINNIYINI